MQAHYRKQVKLASENDPMQIGSPIPGNIVKVMVKKGDCIQKGQAVAVVEAMKMETEILAKTEGTVKEIYIECAQSVKAQELLVELE